MALAKVEQARFTKHNGNGGSLAAKTLQETLRLPRERTFLEKLFKPENLTVAGREVKGLVVPHWAAGVLLAALISIGWTTYSKVAEQRDMLIEMKTELKLAKEHELEYRNEFKTKLNVQQLQIEQLNLMKAVLLPQNGKQTQRKEN